MKKRARLFLLLILILSKQFVFAQQSKIDSLQFALKTAKEDTNKVNTLNLLGRELQLTADYENGLSYANQGKQLAEKLNYKKGEAGAYNNLGNIKYYQGNYLEALQDHFAGLKIKEETGDKKGIATTLGNIGLVYDGQGDYAKALDYYFKALKMDEDLGNKKLIASVQGNIGNVYANQGDYNKALDYYFKALKTDEELKNKNLISIAQCNIAIIYYNQLDYPKALDYNFKALKMAEESESKNIIASVLGNIGNIYLSQGNYPKTLDYYFKALKMDEKLGDKNLIATLLGNVGITYSDLNDYPKALDNYLKALKIENELEDKNGIARTLSNIGALYAKTKKYKEAEEYLQKSLTLCNSIGALNYTSQVEKSLSDLYAQIRQPAKALEHYKKYIATKDSIFNEENTKKTVRSEMNFEFAKKQATAKAEQEKRNAIAQQEKQKQRLVLVFVVCSLFLVVVFAGFIFRSLRITQKQKITIEKQKEKIVDSITYAQLIQQSILMEESEIQKYLPDSFIYFQPKDIVSGDFYWFSKVEGRMELGERRTGNGEQLPAPDSQLQTPNSKLIIAAVDCTGHGVPGAFMSMIGNTLLNQIVNEKQITVPSEILKLLNLGVTEALHQKKQGALSHDGMDITLCCIDYKNNQIHYAGAQNPLYILADNEITVIDADKQSIGGGLITRKKIPTTIEYKNHSIPIKKGMSIFLFSDGYMDQFGGNERKKFGIQKFKELLLTNQHLSMQQQKELLIKAHQGWKRDTAQIDDILVMGIKF